jgi:uncharacterized membrane protein
MTYRMNFLFAVVIGVVIGATGGVAVRDRLPHMVWLSPALAVAAALLGALAGAVAGEAGDYGVRESSLQIVLAVVGVAVAWFLSNRQPVSR